MIDWPGIADMLNTEMRDVFGNARLILDPDDAAYQCDAIFEAPEKDFVPDGEGGVTVAGTGPTADVRLADLPIEPKTRMMVAIELRDAAGEYRSAVRFRITDTQDDGSGGMKLLLIKGG